MIHGTNDLTLRNELNRIFITKCEANRNYSLRAYARDLKIDPTLLSRLMQGKRKFSTDMVKRLSAELNLSLVDTKALLNPRGKFLDTLAFSPISKWYFFAILELLSLPKMKCEVGWVAKRIGLSVTEASAALQVLSDMGHVDIRGKRWKVRTPETYFGDLNTTSREKMNYQKQLLDKAREAIEDVDFARRENASLTISASKKLVPEIKKKIQRFKNELREFIEKSGQSDEVYQIIISYFPLTKDEGV